MEETEIAAAAEDEGAELTEIETLNVRRIDGVKKGSNGFPHLMMKGLAAKADAQAHAPFTGDHEHPHPAFDGPDGDSDGVHAHRHTHDGDNDHHHEHAEPPAAAGKSARDLAAAAVAKAVVNGQIDQGPDVAVGQQIMHLLGQAIINEAQEISAGAYGETMDVSLLTRAADMVGRWVAGEQGGCGCCNECTAPGCGCCWECPGTLAQSVWEYPADDVAKDHREFSAADRKKNAQAGNALPDGSYPIPDADALRRAAVLARSKHGNWQAAEKLIARRAKELGVANPLDEKSDASKSTVADGGTDVHTDAQGTEGLAKAIGDAVTKATEPLLRRIETLDGELAKVKATPLPGGPVLSNVRPTARGDGGDDWAAKAALYRSKADAATAPADREGYRQLAREADEKAQAAPPA
jgi:hypothetical protein